MAAEISGWMSDNVKIKICQQVSLCVQDADLVVTATFSPDPYLKKEMISNGAHIMAVGAARPYLSELYPDLLNSSEVLMCIMNITLYILNHKLLIPIHFVFYLIIWFYVRYMWIAMRAPWLKAEI